MAFVPLAPLGNVAALPLGAHTWLYYQDAAGTIRQHGLLGGSYTTAHTNSANVLVAPADEVLHERPSVRDELKACIDIPFAMCRVNLGW